MRSILSIPCALVFTLIVAVNAVGDTQSVSGFTKNQGQLAPQVEYYSLTAPVDVYLTPHAIILDLRGPTRTTLDGGYKEEGVAIWLVFEGANQSPVIEGNSPLTTRFSYFSGQDPAGWFSDVPCYGEVVYRDLWGNADLIIRRLRTGVQYELRQAEPDLSKAPRFIYRGAMVEVDDAANRVTLRTPYGQIMDCKYTGLPGGTLEWNQDGSPTTDVEVARQPVGNPDAMLWSTFLGGSAEDVAFGMILDHSENPIVTGYTHSSDFPTTPGAYDRYRDGNSEVFLSKVSASGQHLLWSTFIGGSSSDLGIALALVPDGNIVLTGSTGSANFPVTPGAYDVSHNGDSDIFIMKIAPEGNEILWSTLIGGNDQDKEWGHPLAIDLNGNPVLVGRTKSLDIPTTPGAFDRSHNGGYDIYVAKLSSCGSHLLWATFLGGVNNEGESHGYGSGVTLDGKGNLIITGGTSSPDFPSTVGAFDETHNGGYDAFVTRMSSTGDSLIWSTFLGNTDDEIGYCVDLDSHDNAVVTGWTESPGFPITGGAFDRIHGGESDAYLSKISASGSDLIWSSFLGGAYAEQGMSVLVDDSDDPYLVGLTLSPGFPITPEAYDESHNGNYDAFFMKVTSSGSDLLWSTFIGGSEADAAWGIALDSSRNPVVSGYTPSPDFPTTPEAYDVVLDGVRDVFVTHLDIGAMACANTRSNEPEAPPCWRGSPNPFSVSTTLSCQLSRQSIVSITIYDVTGRVVRHLLHNAAPPNSASLIWDGKDDSGCLVVSGLYICEVKLDWETARAKLVIAR